MTYCLLQQKNSFFFFDNSIYCQTDGVVMGFPLGPTLANAFLCHHEKEWLDSYPAKSKLYKRYRDDIFVMFRDNAKKFGDYMNAKHPNIHFTFEIE